MERMTSIKGFDWFSNAVLLIFLSVIMGFGPSSKYIFILAETLFVLTFGARFLIKRYKLTLLVSWSIVFLGVLTISTFYASDKALTFSQIKPVLQVLVFANLLMPHIRESKQSYQTFLYLCLIVSLFMFIRVLLSVPLDVLFVSRMGDPLGENQNTVGYIFSVAAIISLYLFLQNRNWLVLIPLMFFFILSLFSGSLSVVTLLGVGSMLLIVLYQKNLRCTLLVTLFAIVVFVLGTIARLDILGPYASNNYLELHETVGLFGMILYYTLPVYIVVRGSKRFFRFQEKGPFVLSIALMVAMMFDQVVRMTYTEAFSNILIALCYAGIVIDDPHRGLDVFQLFAKIFEWVRHPGMIANHLLKLKISRLLPDNIFLAIKYRMSNGTKLHLNDPKTYNEKLQWQKIHDRNPLYPDLVDKYAVRDFVKEKIGGKYLVPLAGVYDDIAAIDVATLPSSFVLKPTHTSGDVLFCKDKTTFDWEKAKRLMNSWLSSNYYWYDREWVYKQIKPRIICEEMIRTIDDNPPRDYKIFCFDGEPKMAFVASDRSSGTKFDFFDIAWERLPLKAALS